MDYFPILFAFIAGVTICAIAFMKQRPESANEDPITQITKNLQSTMNDVRRIKDEKEAHAKVFYEELRKLESRTDNKVKQYEDWARQSVQGIQDQINDCNTRINEQAPRIVRVYKYTTQEKPAPRRESKPKEISK